MPILVSRTVPIAIGLLVFLVVYATGANGAPGGFEAGRQIGYALGFGLAAAGIAYLVLRLFRPRT